MHDILSRLDSDSTTAVLIVSIVFGTFIVIWLSYLWRGHGRTEIEAALKQDMLNRGMSAEEIERVLHAHLNG